MRNRLAYESWDLTVHRPLPERSYLYHMEPMGLGSAYVESLTGYIARLAEAHDVSTGALMSRELLPRVREASSHCAYKASAQPCSTFVYQSHVLNGVRECSESFVRVLESLTGFRSLRGLTLLAWKEVISNRNVLKSIRAWCPCCFEEWRCSSLRVYEPLLWSIGSVSYCPLHLRALEESCPHCKQKLYVLSARSRPGHCCRCQRWLGERPAPTDASSKAKAGLLAARGIGELLSAASALKGTPSTDHLKNNLRFCIDILAQGSQKRFCRAIGVSLDPVRHWFSANGRIRLDLLSSLCAQLGLSPLRFLNDRLTDFDLESARQIFHRNTAHIRPRRKNPQLDVVFEYALNSNGALSLQEVANQLGYSSAQSLRRRNPSVCDQITRNHRKVSRCKPAKPVVCSFPSDNVIRKALNHALTQTTPIRLKTVARNLGFHSEASLYSRFPDLCRAFAAMNKLARERRVEEMRGAVAAAVIESLPPTPKELANRLGCTVAALQYRFPEYHAALIARLPERKATLKEQIRGVIARALKEEPPLSLEAVAQRVGKNAGYLKSIHPDLCTEIKKRYLAHTDTEVDRRRQEFRAEIRRAVTELHQRGINPSRRQVFASISDPSMRSTHILDQQIAATLRELESSAGNLDRWNHSTATRVWKHPLAETAIGWLE
jgi:AraC-like DNA-binding protein